MKLRNILTSVVFSTVIFLFAAAHILLPDREISVTERRPLDQLPKFTMQSVMNGSYGDKLEEYLLDQFPLREKLRNLKALWQFEVYGQSDNNGIYLVDDQVLKLDSILKEDEVNALISNTNKVYESYLQGMGLVSIAKLLNAQSRTSRYGRPWGKSSIMRVLRNSTYTGNLLLQKTYSENHLTKRTRQNNGELPQYHITDSHEPIISLQQFNAVQEEIKRRADKHTHPGMKQKTYPFTGMVVCGGCGKHYRRKVTKTGSVWICSTFNTMGKAYCPSKQIPESILVSITEEVLGSTDALYDKITAIRAEKDNTLVFCFEDGSETVKRWQDRSRTESWTEEMKEAARQKALERSKTNG